MLYSINMLQIILILTPVILIYLSSRSRKRKAKYYNSLSTNEKILYNLEEVNNKQAGPFETMLWNIISFVLGLCFWFFVVVVIIASL